MSAHTPTPCVYENGGRHSLDPWCQSHRRSAICCLGEHLAEVAALRAELETAKEELSNAQDVVQGFNEAEAGWEAAEGRCRDLSALVVQMQDERDTARTALAELQTGVRGIELANVKLHADLSAMTAERDALRVERDELYALSEGEPWARKAIESAERERERAKVEAEVVAYLQYEAQSWPQDMGARETVRAMADEIECGEHRPPAEPKPGDGEGKM